MWLTPDNFPGEPNDTAHRHATRVAWICVAVALAFATAALGWWA